MGSSISRKSRNKSGRDSGEERNRDRHTQQQQQQNRNHPINPTASGADAGTLRGPSDGGDDAKGVIGGGGFDGREEFLSSEEVERRRKAYRCPSEILPGLFVGSYAQSVDYRMLKNRQICHLLCVKGSARVPPREFQFKHAPMSDYGRTDLEPFFEDVFPFIDSCISKNKKILVYCSQGVNRAPTTAIGYVMYSKRWSLKKAYEHVQTKRPQAMPHENYFERLESYEYKLFGERSYTDANKPESLQEYMRRYIVNQSGIVQMNTRVATDPAETTNPPPPYSNPITLTQNCSQEILNGDNVSSFVSLPSPPARQSTMLENTMTNTLENTMTNTNIGHAESISTGAPTFSRTPETSAIRCSIDTRRHSGTEHNRKLRSPMFGKEHSFTPTTTRLGVNERRFNQAAADTCMSNYVRSRAGSGGAGAGYFPEPAVS